MLIVRDAQMHAFTAAAQAQFGDRMVEILSETFPAKYAALGDAGARDFVRRAMDAAAQNGIESIGAIAVLIELMAEFGERFELSPDKVWARKLLAHPTLPDTPKLAAMRERMAGRTGGRPIVPFRRPQPASP